MSPRSAKAISASIAALALLLMAAGIVVASTTFSRQGPDRLVFVPPEREAEIRAAASALDPDRDCQGAIDVDPALGDAPSVLCAVEEHLTDGSELTWGDLVLSIVIGIVWLGTGALITSRQPGNRAGWIFTAIGLFFFLEGLSLTLVVRGAKTDPGSVPLLGLWAGIAEYALFAFALVPLLFLLYPDGRPPTPGWRWAQRTLVVGAGIAFVGSALNPGPLNNLVDSGVIYLNPLGVPALAGTADAVTALGTLIALGASLSTIVAVRGRFKRSTGEERQQMRWLVFVATLIGAVFLIGMVAGLIIESFVQELEQTRILGIDPLDTVFLVFAFLLVAGVPAAYLIAIFKHGLWDLDVVIKKALVAFVLTLLLVTVGLLVIGLLGQWAFWGGASRTTAIILGVLAGVLVWPLVRLSRRVARRVVFGRRAAPYEVLTEFSEHVGETYSTEDVLPRMAEILATGTGARGARVLLRIGSELREAARWPQVQTEIRAEHVVPVVDRGEELGALAVSMPPSDPMNPSKEGLIRDLAAQAGLVLRNVKLIEELRASRQRLVAAQDEERRKIERNLHDGAQQQLVALTVQLKLARDLVERDPAKVSAMLDSIQGSATDALDDLRDLARGIYPPLLADQGLAAALEAQARKAAVPTTVRAETIGRYAQDVEAAVYFCALEALNNVAKYAEATRATVTLSQQNGRLTFSVDDDGRGFDPNAAGRGTGLQGMADRLEAIGGELAIETSPGGGTTVLGRIPTSGRRS
ncbi:MAG TPA: GAF domain-containing sensor histidine kinase [Actinomycetota bacterium]|nr:GAF domain-containing sensor histidine kinase [Actinomycetota bacterium]